MIYQIKRAMMVKQEMMEADTCLVNGVIEYPDGTALAAIPYINEGRCHDCNVKAGGNHHPGCDMERCPKCKGQLISYGCLESV